MELAQEVVDRLLLAKFLLGQIRSEPVARSERLSLAHQILTAHDAAELAIAGIASFLDCIPHESKTYLMEYFPAITAKTGNGVPGRDYFSALNRVRVGFKHHGDFPDPLQWHRVAENVYRWIDTWCRKYIGISFDSLDESALIHDEEVKAYLAEARKERERDDHKRVLEILASALLIVLEHNSALRNIGVGLSRAEDAIKLAAFGVHGNDLLALQEFLPRTWRTLEGNIKTEWKQKEYGHPGNWTKTAADFCLKTFVHVAVRIQDAEWIPGAIPFPALYEYKVTALEDGVEIIQQRRANILQAAEAVVVRTLRNGESFTAQVSQADAGLAGAFLRGGGPRMIDIFASGLWGQIRMDKVRVTCVPRDSELVQKYFSNLREIEWVPED